MRFLQRLPTPAVDQPASGWTPSDRGSSASPNEASAGSGDICVDTGDGVPQAKAAEAGASPSLKPRSLNRSARPRSRCVEDKDGTGYPDGREAVPALQVAAPSSCASVPSSFSPLPSPPVVLPASSLRSSIIVTPVPPPPPHFSPSSPGCTTHKNPSSPPEDLFRK